ncbi:hypothetical protein V1264_015104 [Littorina saxatilis]|uniref:BHLH domain-containing protein n=2 Tax=Littorina saxatilis TaxID=31220 RepID=A0AAN9BKA4_9CAEN
MSTRKLTCREEFSRPVPVLAAVPGNRRLQFCATSGRPRIRVLPGAGKTGSKEATHHKRGLEGNDLDPVQSCGHDNNDGSPQPTSLHASSPSPFPPPLSAHRQPSPKKQQPLDEKLRSHIDENRSSLADQPYHLQSLSTHHGFHDHQEHELLQQSQDREFRQAQETECLLTQEDEFRLTQEREFEQLQEQAHREYRELQEEFHQRAERDDDPMAAETMDEVLTGKASDGGAAETEKTRNPEKKTLPRYKRPAHIDAEYRRRGKIQKGFELVQTLVPALRENAGNGKMSKASTLFKTSMYLRELVGEVGRHKSEMEQLRSEIDNLQREIEGHQQLLPSSGVNAVERPGCHVDRMLDNYLHGAISQDWKFWIFSFLVRPLSESFARSVSLTTHDDFLRTIAEWSDSQLNLVNLRPKVLSLLRYVCTTTSIMSQPEKMEQEVHDMLNCDVKPAAV